jgi:putative transposase
VSWLGLARAVADPAGERAGLSWREFLRAPAQSMFAVDFFTVETISLRGLYLVFYIELGSRRVHLAGCTPDPDNAWVTQQARWLAWTLPERATPVRFLVRDRDSKFTRDFDNVSRSDAGKRGAKVVIELRAGAAAGIEPGDRLVLAA